MVYKIKLFYIYELVNRLFIHKKNTSLLAGVSINFGKVFYKLRLMNQLPLISKYQFSIKGIYQDDSVGSDFS